MRVDDHIELAVAEPVELAQLIGQCLLACVVRGGVAQLDVVRVMPEQELHVADRIRPVADFGDDRAYQAAYGFAGASLGCGLTFTSASSQASASSPAP